MHGPRGPEVSAIHPPRECRGQPPTRPAGLVQWDLKVRLRRSPRVLERRGLRGGHGGGQRGLRSAAGPRPAAHRRPVVGPLGAARRSCARRRTRRLGGEQRRAAEEREGKRKKRERGGETSSESRLAVEGRGLPRGWKEMKWAVAPFPEKLKCPAPSSGGFRFTGTRFKKQPVAHGASARTTHRCSRNGARPLGRAGSASIQTSRVCWIPGRHRLRGFKP